MLLIIVNCDLMLFRSQKINSSKIMCGVEFCVKEIFTGLNIVRFFINQRGNLKCSK